MTRSATRWFSRNEPDCCEQLVDEGGLAMVDMRDDRDVAEFHYVPVPREISLRRNITRHPVATMALLRYMHVSSSWRPN